MGGWIGAFWRFRKALSEAIGGYRRLLEASDRSMADFEVSVDIGGLGVELEGWRGDLRSNKGNKNV